MGRLPLAVAAVLMLLALPAPAASAPELGWVPREVRGRCQLDRRPKGAPDPAVRVRDSALFGATAKGRILECRPTCPAAAKGEPYPPECAESFAHYWVFVLREERGTWRVVHRFKELYEEGISVRSVVLAQRELLVEEHHGAGRGVQPRISVLGGEAAASKLVRLFGATIVADDELVALQELCRLEPSGDTLTIVYRGEGRPQDTMRPRIKVKLDRVRECPGAPKKAPPATGGKRGQ
jgi:hypothetical protein